MALGRRLPPRASLPQRPHLSPTKNPGDHTWPNHPSPSQPRYPALHAASRLYPTPPRLILATTPTAKAIHLTSLAPPAKVYSLIYGTSLELSPAMEELLLRHAGLPRPVAPRRRLRVITVALRTRPTSLAVPPTARAHGAAVAGREPVLPLPPVAADATAVLLAAGVPPADLRRAAGMCPELLSVPAETIATAFSPSPSPPRQARARPAWPAKPFVQ